MKRLDAAHRELLEPGEQDSARSISNDRIVHSANHASNNDSDLPRGTSIATHKQAPEKLGQSSSSFQLPFGPESPISDAVPAKESDNVIIPETKPDAGEQTTSDGSPQKIHDLFNSNASSRQPSESPNALQETTTVENHSMDATKSGSTQFTRAAGHLRGYAAILKQNGNSQNRSQKSINAYQDKLGSSELSDGKSDAHQAASQPSREGHNSAGGASVADNSGNLDVELPQQLKQDWGRLPGRLRTEILQGAGKKTHPEYSQRIKAYFDEITKPKSIPVERNR